MEYTVFGIRALLIGVLAAAVIGKVRGRSSYAAFTGAVSELVAVGRRTARVLAPLTILVELTTGGLLAVPAADPAGFAATAALMIAFTVVLARARRAGREASCHCFGTSGTSVGTHHVVRNLALVALAVGGAAGTLAGPQVPPRPAGIAITCFVALIGLIAVVRLDDLVSLFASAAAPR